MCACMYSLDLFQGQPERLESEFITKDFTFIFRYIQDLIHCLRVAHPMFVTD